MKIVLTVMLLFCGIGVVHSQIIEMPENTRFYYTGIIENVDKVQLNVHIDELNVSGGLVMENSSEHYFVEGRMAANKTGMGIRIYDSERNYFAAFELNVISEEGSRYKKLTGKYKARNNQVNKVVLTKIAEFANGQEMAEINNTRWSD